ncbi:UDP-phosphate N-acetylglucosaminyl 1-phosphate transferase [Clostridiales bacterium PH28_bin88]|nr:UDP-phosphate N-acetylglucosaminyl 1-phosphate transferase [Clostridiales bacterium PH28_bin88]
MSSIPAALLAAFTVVYLLTPQIKKLAIRVGAVDAPNERKVHARLMPRLGGLAIYLGFTVVVLLTQPLTRSMWGLLLGGTLITLVGVVDDIKGLSPRVKLLGQVLAALVLVGFGIQVKFITNPFGDMFFPGRWGIPVTLLWVIGMTNALNLIDGLDGLAAGTAAIAAVTMAVIAWLEGQVLASGVALILAVSVLGFIRYNFNPAQIFMGDSGAMFLGFNLAALAIMGLTKGATVISLFIPVVILGIPIMDTFFAIVRRFFNRKPIFEADKHHLHHCLLDMGLSHRQTVLVIYLVNICLGISAVLLTRLTTDQSVLMLTGLTALILLGANKVGVVRGVSLRGQRLKREEQQKEFFRA